MYLPDTDSVENEPNKVFFLAPIFDLFGKIKLIRYLHENFW